MILVRDSFDLRADPIAIHDGSKVARSHVASRHPPEAPACAP